VISALNISRDYCYAEITEIRRDRREDFKSRQGLLFVQSRFSLVQSDLAHSQLWPATVLPVSSAAFSPALSKYGRSGTSAVVTELAKAPVSILLPPKCRVAADARENNRLYVSVIASNANDSG
jgi:hypothetical protein